MQPKLTAQHRPLSLVSNSTNELQKTANTFLSFELKNRILELSGEIVVLNSVFNPQESFFFECEKAQPWKFDMNEERGKAEMKTYAVL